MLPPTARYPLALLALTAALTSAGCAAKTLAATPPPTPPTTAATTTAPTAAPTTASTTAPATTAAPRTSSSSVPVQTPTTMHSRFANTALTAELVSYNPQLGMVVFRRVDRYRSATVQDHFGVDPTDGASHRLPVAAAARVFGIGGGSEICPDGAARCTTKDLIKALQQGKQPVVDLVVDGTDHISTVAEQLGVLD